MSEGPDKPEFADLVTPPPAVPNGRAMNGRSMPSLSERAPAVRMSDGRDDLTLVRGIDVDLAHRLNALGVTRFAQIAAWQSEDVRRMAGALELGRRISRENWIEQAELLARRYAPKQAPPPAPSVTAAISAVEAVFKSVSAEASAVQAAAALPPKPSPAAILPRPQRTTLDLADVVRLLRSNAPARQTAERLAAAAARSVVATLPPPIMPIELTSEIVLPDVPEAAAVANDVPPVTPRIAESQVMPEPVAAILSDEEPARAIVERRLEQAPFVQPKAAPPAPVAEPAPPPVAKKILHVAGEPVVPAASALTRAAALTNPDHYDIRDTKPHKPAHEVMAERVNRLEAEIKAMSPELVPPASEAQKNARGEHPDDADIEIVTTRRPVPRTKSVESSLAGDRPLPVSQRDIEEASVIIVGDSSRTPSEPSSATQATHRPEPVRFAGFRRFLDALTRKPV